MESTAYSKYNNITHSKTLAVIIRSIFFWITISAFLIPYTITAYFLYPLPAKPRHIMLVSWANIFTILAKYMCKVKYVVYGYENLERLNKQQAIIASNHQSTWETMAFTYIFPPHVWILKRELLRIPFFGWAIRTLSPIAINRKERVNAAYQVVTQSFTRIKDGLWILVFPEGTRLNPGENKPYKTGVGHLGVNLKIPILPVSHNAGYIMPRSSFWLYPGTVTIIIDKPIYSKQNEKPEALTARLESIIKKNAAKLLH
jgi:1-acyl-sn-glycerol-3-phosphate acyltransferase